MTAAPRPGTIKLAPTTILGENVALELAETLDRMSVSRPGVIVDEAVAGQSAVARVVERLVELGRAPVPLFYSRSGAEPDYGYLDEVAVVFRSASPDAVIGIGGGSTLDLAKGVGILIANEGRGIDYRGVDLVAQPPPPVICLPTTAGSGSEATATASFIDRVTQTKLGINGRHVSPALALLDPTLLADCPRTVTVGSGLDALVHSIEAVSARSANSHSVILGCEAARLLFDALPRAVHDPRDLEARADSLVGAHLAGMAMQNAAGGPASGISYPLGVHFGVPHGYAGGILLPHVVAANLDLGWSDGYARLAEAVGAPMREESRAADFSTALFELYERLGAPSTFANWGIGPGDIDDLTILTLEQRAENLGLNPVPFGRAEVVRLLEAAIEGGSE